MRRWLLAGTTCLAATGCFQVVNPDVTGPHGEHLMELQCPTPADCMSYARQVCGGDFDLVTNSVSGGYKSGTKDTMLVQCKSGLDGGVSGAPRPATH